jgi:hypothetical protein
VPSTSPAGSESELPASTKLPKEQKHQAESSGRRMLDDVLQNATEVRTLNFLAKVYHLNKHGQYHVAIDEVLAFFDEALLENNIAQCQQALRQLDVNQLSASVLKTVLVITGKAKAWLPERESFFKRAKDHLARTRSARDAARLLDKHC